MAKAARVQRPRPCLQGRRSEQRVLLQEPRSGWNLLGCSEGGPGGHTPAPCPAGDLAQPGLLPRASQLLASLGLRRDSERGIRGHGHQALWRL